MSTKRKGTRAERELAHMFWNTGLWSVVRSAGSGNTSMASPDLIAGSEGRSLAIECKSVKKTSKYLHKDEIDQLKEFSNRFGAEAWLGVRFDNLGWFFLDLEKLAQTKKGNYNVPLNLALKEGLKFDELIGKYRQKRL